MRKFTLFKVINGRDGRKVYSFKGYGSTVQNFDKLLLYSRRKVSFRYVPTIYGLTGC
jgi:hypothetical protein